MVVAQEMKHGVYGQVLRLVGISAAVLLSLCLHSLQAQHHISQIAAARVRVGLIDGEAEHVRGRVHSPVLQIDGVNAFVVGKQHADLARLADGLAFQGGRGGLLHQVCRLRMAQTALRAGNADLVRHVYLLRPGRAAGPRRSASGGFFSYFS